MVVKFKFMLKVSVILPVYNVQKYLYECLDSIRDQTLKEIEVLCINDASTDDSLKILLDYQAYIPGLRIVNLEENGGVGHARNLGFRMAAGKYVYFLDPDDMLAGKTVLEILYERAEQEHVDGLLFDSQIIYESEQLRKVMNGDEEIVDGFEMGIYSGSEYFCRLMSEQKYAGAAWRQLWNKNYLLHKGIQFREDISISQDRLFTFQAILSAERLFYMPRIMHIYRVRKASTVTKPLTKEKFLAHCKCIFASLRFIENRTPNPRETAALSRFVLSVQQYIQDNLVDVIQGGEDLNSAVMKTGWDELYLKLLLLGDYPYLGRLFTPGEYQMMKKSRLIIVYGAGRAGENVQRLLERFGFYDYKVAVTKKQADARDDLYEISEFKDYGSDCIVIVAVTKKYRSEMENILDSLGLLNHISLSE